MLRFVSVWNLPRRCAQRPPTGSCARPATRYGWLLRSKLARALILVEILVSATCCEPVRAQQAPAAPAAPVSPHPIYWRQNQFMIPYQWSSTSDPSSAEAVWLFVSKDQGANWQQVGTGKPNLRGFQYHAESDGEFLFSIRTIDRAGHRWPAGPHQPELRVLVDTTLPRVEQLTGVLSDDGSLELTWQATDQNLDPETFRIEVQPGRGALWQMVPVPTQVIDARGIVSGRARWQVPAQATEVAVRATVYDLAGNRAVRGAEAIRQDANQRAERRADSPTLGSARGTQPALRTDAGPPGRSGGRRLDPRRVAQSAPITDPFANSTTTLPEVAAPVNQPLAAATSNGGASGAADVAWQPWPADDTVDTPVNQADGTPAPDRQGVTVYGTPAATVLPPQSVSDASSGVGLAAAPYGRQAESDWTSVNTRFASSGPAPAAQATPFGPLAPFRERQEDSSQVVGSASEAAPQATARPSDASAAAASSDAPPFTAWSPADAVARSPNQAWIARYGNSAPDGVEPMMVASPTFELEYELESVGRWGVSKVELWGTRDGGLTWRSYAVDGDHRSPLRASVEGQGLYGFRIIVDSAGGPGSPRPARGDRPELWVGVDLERPQAELLAVAQGNDNLADHLIIQWRAEDDNLDNRPIALFYSSRPTGPWSAVATGLENTSQYNWRLERHLPTKIHLRMEVRDTAGNLTAYQTANPVVIRRPEATGHLRAVRAVGSGATAAPGAP